MRRVVPDASVILKWVLPAERETHVDEAMALLDAFSADELALIVPSLWVYEVGNTVTRQHPDTAEEIMADLLALGMEESPYNASLAAQTIRLATRYSVTFYDAAYHALALIHDAVLVSADRRYLRAVASEANAISLAEWAWR